MSHVIRILYLAVRALLALLGVGSAVVGGLTTAIVGVVVTLIPIAVYNGVKLFGDYMLNYIFEKVVSAVPAAAHVVQLSGLAAWFSHHLLLPTVLAMLLSAIVLKITISILTLGIVK